MELHSLKEKNDHAYTVSKNRELNTKEEKTILLVWIVMNLENDRWKICMQISEENHLSL